MSSIAASATISGTAELDELFDSMAAMIERDSIMKSMLEEPAKILSDEMRKNIQKSGLIDTGYLLDSTYHHVYKINQGEGQYGFNAGVYENKSMYNSYRDKGEPTAPLVMYWLEYGVQPHHTGSGSNIDVKNREKTGLLHPGISPKPVVTPAWNSKREQAYNSIANQIGKEIDKL